MQMNYICQYTTNHYPPGNHRASHIWKCLISRSYPPASTRYWWPDTLIITQVPGSSVQVVSRWLGPGNRTFLEVASMVVTWWIVVFLHSVETYTAWKLPFGWAVYHLCDIIHKPIVHVHFVSVSGGWSNFGNWSECDAECGGGMQSRDRSCDNPKPVYGLPCPGNSTEYRECNVHLCPSKSDFKRSKVMYQLRDSLANLLILQTGCIKYS